MEEKLHQNEARVSPVLYVFGQNMQTSDGWRLHPHPPGGALPLTPALSAGAGADQRVDQQVERDAEHSEGQAGVQLLQTWVGATVPPLLSARVQEETLALRKEGIGVVLDSELPHLIGIDDDLLSTGIILYHLKVGPPKRCSSGPQPASPLPHLLSSSPPPPHLLRKVGPTWAERTQPRSRTSVSGPNLEASAQLSHRWVTSG